MDLYLQDPIRTEWGRHRLLICNVDGPPGTPATVVVKAAVEQDGAIFNEWSVLRWLGDMPSVASRVPAIYAGHIDKQLIVLEDLGCGPSLHRITQTEPQWAAAALAESQRLAAVMHGATRGRSKELDAIRDGLPEGRPPPHLDTSTASLIAELRQWTPTVPAAVADEIERVAATLDVEPAFEALTFHDACPVNRIVTAGTVRAVDLEMAAFRHPMIDGAYGAIGHLRCSARRMRANDGIALPLDVRRATTDAYREAVLPGYPEYEDRERFDDDLAAAAAVWMVEILRRNRRGATGDKAGSFFAVTARQRVTATLLAFIDVAEETGRLPALAVWVREAAHRLRSTWPDDPPLLVAGAFTAE